MRTAYGPELNDLIKTVAAELDEALAAQALKQKQELHAQVETLIRLGYPEAAGRPASVFRTAAMGFAGDVTATNQSFLFVIPLKLIAAEFQFAKLVGDPEKARRNCRISTEGIMVWDTDDRIPAKAPYIISDIAGKEYQRAVPANCIREIKNRGRLPLTLTETLATAMRFPKQMRKRNVIGGTRYGNAVTAPELRFFSGDPMLDSSELDRAVEKFAILHCASRTFLKLK